MIFSSSKLCSRPIKQAEQVIPMEVPTTPVDMRLEEELYLSDDSSNSSAMEVDEIPETSSHNWAIKNAETLTGRLKIHVDALSMTLSSFNRDKFTSDPRALSFWLDELQTFLNFSFSISERCALVRKLQTIT